MEEAGYKVKQILESRADLMKILRGVYLEWAPKRQRPYATVTVREQARDYGLMLDVALDVDLWFDGPSRFMADKAQRQIKMALNDKQLDVSYAGKVRVYFQSGGILRDEDPNVIRYNLVYALRGWEQYLTE